MAWFNASWLYRKQIDVTNNVASVLTDFQVLISVDTATLVSAGKMQSSGADIRFCDTDETTEIKFWIESGMNTSATRIYVKIPSLASSATEAIYIYYGNSGASDGQDGANTFVFFDDFASMDWTTNWASTTQGLYTVAAGVLSLAATSTTSQLLRTQATYTNIFIEARLKTSITDASNQPYFMFSDKTTFEEEEAVDWISATSRNYIAGVSASAGTISVDTYYRVYLALPSSGTATSTTYTEPRTQINTKTGTPTDTTGYLQFLQYGSSGTGTCDWVHIRKFVLTEPTHSIGSEVAAPQAPVAAFSGTPVSGTVPLTVTFTDSSTQTPTSWSWVFGDSGTSTSQNPVYKYNNPGLYNVTLTATNATGSDPETKTGYVRVLDFSGTITVGTGVTIGKKELRTSWPVAEGLTAGTTSQKGREMSLKPQISSLVPQRLKAGF